jgi:hypothetical protein
MICTLVLTLFLVVNVQRAEGKCCVPNNATYFFGMVVMGSEKDLSFLFQLFLRLKVFVPQQLFVRTVM